jgi:hypothetical protein
MGYAGQAVLVVIVALVLESGFRAELRPAAARLKVLSGPP